MKNFIQLFYQDFLLKFAPMGFVPAFVGNVKFDAPLQSIILD